MLPMFGGVKSDTGVWQKWQNTWLHTWWFIAINVKYAYAAKAGFISFNFNKCQSFIFQSGKDQPE